MAEALTAPPAAGEELDDPRLAQWAAPELLGALRIVLPVLQHQLEALLEIGCDWKAGEPIRSTLDRGLVDDVAELEDAIEAGELVVRKATTPPHRLSAADQAALIARFPPPDIEELRHG